MSDFKFLSYLYIKKLVTYFSGNIWTRKPSIFPNGLEDLLKQNADGHMVLLRRNKLDENCRQKLVKIIVDYLIIQKNPQWNEAFTAIEKVLAYFRLKITRSTNYGCF
ncbi:hypothetical protein JTB14_014400 [Gonioctena quinquepunctata]|nr:hypothetical protein JTB14_014400 [Gonioctena quinquepunctata]